jgi:Tol biopolymer transport system component
MVYEQRSGGPRDIWRVPGRTAPVRDRAPERFITSSHDETNQAYSPDGRRIAFASYRSGTSDVWICDSDGSNPIQLTSFRRHAGCPRWSPDGRTLVFDSNEAGDWNLYTIDADGGVPRRVTQPPFTGNLGIWSPTGLWIYFASQLSGDWEVWRIPSEGGEAVQVTRDGGGAPAVSPDGRYLYYSKSAVASGIWRVPMEGGEETEIVREAVHPKNYALSGSGIYFATERPRGRRREYTIRYLNPESGQTTEVFRKEGPFDHMWIAVSPDEEWILYGERPAPSSELMLVENFR